MKKYILIRVLKAILTIWFVWTAIFLLARLSGDPVEWMLGDVGTVAAKEQLRINLGLNLPLEQQYLNSITGVFRGDAGKSYYFVRPVTQLFTERLGATASLGAIVFVFTIILGIPLGVFAAVKHNTVMDRFTMAMTLAGYTIPNFVFGILLILIFSLLLRILPSGNTGTPLHYIMPALALAVGPTASAARLTRSSMLDVIGQDYLDTARAKGVREWVVIYKHALRNALIPVVTILGAQLSYLIGGSVIVETVFSWPGIGTLLISAARQRDFPVVQYGVLLIATSVVFVNLCVDLSYALLDPRIRENY
jgi:ABC-type dipeptide/oligopeptide/nickel transport system permease component